MRHILFPTDFSPRCDAMAPAAAALARQFGSRVTLMHVLETGRMASDFAPVEHHFGTLREELEGFMERYKLDVFQGLDVDRVLKIGHAVDEVVTYAKETGADLIVMPTHGRTRFRELLLGSVTAGVLHDTDSSVLTSAHADEIKVWTALPGSIVCAIDLSPFSVDVLNTAAYFADKCQAELHIVHAMSTLEHGLAGGMINLEGELQAEKARNDYIPLAAAAEITQPLEIFRAVSIPAAILQAEQKYAADLLIIGRGKMQGVLGRLRSHAHELIRRSTCPVLSV